jgi:hypothetical protein
VDAKLTVRQRLERAVLEQMASAMTRASEWGVDDCTLWAVEPIRQVLGYDPAAPGRGRYRTRRGALRVIGKGGLPAAMRRAARRHGWRKVDPRHARAGDLGLMQIDGVYTMTLCRARGWFVARSERGFVAVRASQQRAAWKVLG